MIDLSSKMPENHRWLRLRVNLLRRSHSGKGKAKTFPKILQLNETEKLLGGRKPYLIPRKPYLIPRLLKYRMLIRKQVEVIKLLIKTRRRTISLMRSLGLIDSGT
jgi:hypothetical protein